MIPGNPGLQTFGMALILATCGCAVIPRGSFIADNAPEMPVYSEPSAWAAQAGRRDSADLVPGAGFTDNQDSALVDVFFVHPTTYTGKKGEKNWNAPVNDAKLNQRTDKGTIRYQATVFNGSARVFAPRYRQAHLEVFYTKKRKAEAEQALDLAYEDVRAAFKYYLEVYNQGRPFIMAGHSQGTVHAARLLRELVDGKPLQKRLVVAYLIGMPVSNTFFENIPVCQEAEQTGCFCSWRTFKSGHYPRKWYDRENSDAVTNPISWTTTGEYAGKERHKGAVMKPFYQGPRPQTQDARAVDGILWTSKISIPFAALFIGKNYHIADYNLFYVDIRENIAARTSAFLNHRE